MYCRSIFDLDEEELTQSVYWTLIIPSTAVQLTLVTNAVNVTKMAMVD